jgi:hypothetical protein
MGSDDRFPSSTLRARNRYLLGHKKRTLIVRFFSAAVLIVIGVAFILIRSFYARFLFSFVHTLASFKVHEQSILKWIRIATVIGGSAFILLGILVGLGVVNFASPR